MIAFRFANGPPEPHTSKSLVVEVPRNMDSKDPLLSFLAANLNFPSYFGMNWDALDECLSDLSWLNVDKVVLWHSDVPFFAGSQDRKSYLELLNSLCKEELRRKIEVIFPSDMKDEVESTLARQDL